MKIAILGSAPSSARKAPFGDISWKIWGCSPGAYPIAVRADAWFELHRWEPPILGVADQQKPWFSPEYCGWLAQRQLVWMRDEVKEIPGSKAFPYEDLVNKYGNFFFTSSVAWMLAMAIEAIQNDREARKDSEQQDTQNDAIGLWGVDMAANEEYADQRPGCQFFVQLAASLGIEIVVPPESDLMAPALLYAIDESSHMMIKITERRREIEGRLANARTGRDNLTREEAFLTGALDDISYMIKTWTNREPGKGVRFEDIFPKQR